MRGFVGLSRGLIKIGFDKKFSEIEKVMIKNHKILMENRASCACQVNQKLKINDWTFNRLVGNRSG